MNTLDTEISKLNRVGQTTANRLKRLGIESVQDLLYFFPFRYEDFGEQIKIDNLVPGPQTNVIGEIELIQNKRSPRKKMSITEALVNDGTDTLKVVWFNQPFISKNLHIGDKVSLSGKVEEDYGALLMKSPSYEKLGVGGGMHTQGLVPNYHLTANLTHKQVRFLIKQVIALATQIEDWIPRKILKANKLIEISEAISKIHFPKNRKDIELAKRRIAFGELFLINLQSVIIKNIRDSEKALPLLFNKKETKRFVDNLPFSLTNAQRIATWEILQDMEKPKPMARLLEGDVGSGKTVVAVLAMLNAYHAQAQSVLMVPTEVLASQHFESIGEYLAKTKARVVLATRSRWEFFGDKSKNKKSEIKKMIESGIANVIIGTHALIQESVQFHSLALSIIDEQHRFGVDQRKQLISKSGDPDTTPHLLSMTATPIPRSLALALFGDLDISIIREMPKNRKKIITRLVEEKKRMEMYGFIRQQIKEGRQVFVICPLIDYSDKLGVKSVRDEFKRLEKNIFPDLNIAMLHGRLKAKEKEKVMNDFQANKINILVSTSVVEVGVDIPNASIMMIEGAERFGLAQLHQFRGRVGRGEHQSYCFLFSGNLSAKSYKRLKIMESCFDGFSLAEEDLKTRGPGEVYGTAQKGFPELKMASLFDYELMKKAKDAAQDIIKNKSGLNEYPELKNKIKKLQTSIHKE